MDAVELITKYVQATASSTPKNVQLNSHSVKYSQYIKQLVAVKHQCEKNGSEEGILHTNLSLI